MSWLILILASLAALGLGAPARCSKRKTSPTRATWLWETTTITESAYVADFLTLAQANQITRVYAQIDPNIKNSAWEGFISQCNTSGITVDALIGNANWILGSGTPTLQTELDWIEQFQGNASAGAKFAGLHMDIEPWALDGWAANKATYIKAWEGIVQEVVSLGKSLSMSVAADMPFFAYTLNSSTAGQTVDTWMLDVLDSATFMTYRTTASEVEELAAPILAAGDSTGTPVWLAVEVIKDAEADDLSFYGESTSALDTALTEITTSSNSSASFMGIAVHIT